MGAFLIDHWLADLERIVVIDDASVSEVREAIRARGGRLPAIVIEKLVASASELVRNQLAHAVGGVVGLREIERAGVAGLEVIAADRGQGIADPAAALRGEPRVSGSLGIGLSAVVRQVDELDIDVRRGAGSCLSIRSFAASVPRSEVGIVAQPHPDESVIGDHALVTRDGTSVLVAVADGLGHGPLARIAAIRAVEAVAARPRVALDEHLAASHAALAGTRGAVMSIARLGDRLEHAGIGNIATRVVRDGVTRPLLSTAGTLGSAFPRRVHVEQLPRGELLVMTSDGLTSRVELGREAARQHPIVTAQDLLARFARRTDDAIVLVVR